MPLPSACLPGRGLGSALAQPEKNKRSVISRLVPYQPHDTHRKPESTTIAPTLAPVQLNAHNTCFGVKSPGKCRLLSTAALPFEFVMQIMKSAKKRDATSHAFSKSWKQEEW